VLRRRASGILMHLTSLPSKYGIGDLGPDAYKFVDFLAAAGQNYWQILPLNPTTSRTRYSPYNCLSAFAGNPLLISPDLLYRDGLLTRTEIADPPRFPVQAVDYDRVSSYKERLLDAAFARFRDGGPSTHYEVFVQEHRAWLEPYAAFVAWGRHFRRRLWCDWPAALRDGGLRIADCGWESSDAANPQSAIRHPQLPTWIERERFRQYIFYRQYLDLKRYANDRGIQVAGDVPIYVAYDSADVWSHPAVFRLTRSRRPRFVAGVPPDYFSKTGQLWSNPVYDWRYLEQTKFDWWIRRMKHNLLLFDFVRIDHFRGLVAYWQVPAHHKNAMRGKWVPVPHESFFRELFRQVPFAPLFAEDLGSITAEVREVVARYDLPRMNVLQFAFGGDPAGNPHMPHNYAENSIVYTGTHDNNTTRGWFEKDLGPQARKRVFDYLGCMVSAQDVSWELLRAAMRSVARITIIPMQDVLNLGSEARMNFPAHRDGNWRWRMRPGQTGARLADQLRSVTEACGRV
jgi:4-alpha-glucanotransferase